MHGRNQRGVRVPERVRKRILQKLAHGGVAARLEGGDELAVRIAFPQRLECELERGRVMAEIFNRNERRRIDEDFPAAFYALKF